MKVKFSLDIDVCKESKEDVEERVKELIDDLMYQLGKDLAVTIDDYHAEFER